MSGPVKIAGRSYKWIILGVVFLAQMLAIGSTSFGFGLFVKPITSEFGVARSTVNLGIMLLVVGMAVASPFIGRALDRFPARWIMLAGALLFGAGALIAAQAKALWVLAAALFLPLAFGSAMLGPLPGSTLVARWFDENRGRALGIAAISMSVGGMVMVPAMAYLIEEWGWRRAVEATGLVVAGVVALLAVVAVRERARPDASVSAATAIPSATWTTATLLRTRDFWLLVLAVGLMLAISQGLLSSLVAYGTDRGFSAAQAAALVTAVSASSIAGKLVIGYLADLVDKRLLLALVALLAEVFLALLLWAPSYPVLISGCFAAGAAIGGTSPVWTSLISSRFGVASFGTVMGLMVPVQMPLLLGAIFLIGNSYDRTGSYQEAFLIYIGLGLVALMAALTIGRPGHKQL